MNDNMEMKITTFSYDCIGDVAKIAAGVWGKEQGAHGEKVSRIFCEHLSRYSCYSSAFALQAEDEEGIQAVAFAWLPGDTNDAGDWLRQHLDGLTEEEQQVLLRNEQYLKRTDGMLQSKMEGKAAKLSFFISRKPGYGTPILNALIDLLREQGIEWLYLWTDCTCNWQYYVKHGYEQIGQGIAPEFSTDTEDYDFRMFRKRIN